MFHGGLRNWWTLQTGSVATKGLLKGYKPIWKIERGNTYRLAGNPEWACGNKLVDLRKQAGRFTFASRLAETSWPIQTYKQICRYSSLTLSPSFLPLLPSSFPYPDIVPSPPLLSCSHGWICSYRCICMLQAHL